MIDSEMKRGGHTTLSTELLVRKLYMSLFSIIGGADDRRVRQGADLGWKAYNREVDRINQLIQILWLTKRPEYSHHDTIQLRKLFVRIVLYVMLDQWHN